MFALTILTDGRSSAVSSSRPYATRHGCRRGSATPRSTGPASRRAVGRPESWCSGTESRAA